MSYTTECMTPADIAAVTRNNNNDGMFGGESAWWIIILLLFGWGGRGFGFGGGYSAGQGGCGCSPCATQADLSAAFASNATLNGINGIDSTLCQGFNGIQQSLLQGFAGVDNAVCTLGYNMQGGFNALGHQISDCCCTTQRAIDNVRYDMATQACDTRNTIQNTT